jgi:Fur family ferric uptake transcriptional regulator
VFFINNLISFKQYIINITADTVKSLQVTYNIFQVFTAKFLMDQNKELKKAGLKVTLPRLKILEILQEPQNQHISAEDVYKILIDQGEEIGLATVYRVLNQFDDAGLLNRHHFEGGKSVFEISHKEHHDHLVCLTCGKVFEFEDDVIEKRQDEIAAQNNMKLTNHSLYLYGECTKVNCENEDSE